MKKLAILSLGLLLMYSCSNSPQSMAEKGVKDYLKKSIKAYQPISFGVLDTLSLEKDSAYISAKDSMQFFMDKLKEVGDQFKLADNQKNAKRLKAVMADIAVFYDGKKFKINHKYKGNTAEGKNQDVDKDFYLNNMYEVVE